MSDANVVQVSKFRVHSGQSIRVTYEVEALDKAGHRNSKEARTLAAAADKSGTEAQRINQLLIALDPKGD